MLVGRVFIIDGLHEFKYKEWHFEQATPERLLQLEDQIRDKDKEEAMALTGYKTFHECMLSLINTSNTVPIYLLKRGKDVMGIGGVCGKGIVWLVLTKQEKNHTLGFLQFSKRFLPKLIEAYGHVTNIVWTKNTKHVKYLDWLGAEWEDISPDFSIFYIRRKER